MNSKVTEAVRTFFSGIGQVMFQQSHWTGLIFLVGIFVGSYESQLPQVAWGAVAGTIASTIAGYIVTPASADGKAGLWGFNGALVGCAIPTFMADTWLMWLVLVFCAMLTTWVRSGLNNLMAPWKLSSYTFPFVLMTWVFLFAARTMTALEVTSALTEPDGLKLDISLVSLIVYWLKGISQVFLIDSWMTGFLFLIALVIGNRRAAIWAGAASAIALAVAILFKADPEAISQGLFGFSPVLTGIAVGCSFHKPSVRNCIWTATAVLTAVFVQAAMNVLLAPYGVAALTGPFCITTWIFMLPKYSFNGDRALTKEGY